LSAEEKIYNKKQTKKNRRKKKEKGNNMDIELSYTVLPGQSGAVAEGATHIYTHG